MPNPQEPKQRPMAVHLVAGGAAGLVESSICHPFDTVKTRLQLQQSSLLLAPPSPAAIASSASGSASAGTRTRTGAPAEMEKAAACTRAIVRNRRSFSSVTTTPAGAMGMARSIVVHEGVPSLYKGLTAVWGAVVPKMAIRFVSFEWYRDRLGSVHRRSVNFVAGLASGLTEAVLVVTPAEVCKIRMQSQRLHPPEAGRGKYTNAAQTAAVIVREEGLGALWRGVVPTMMRQGCNQAVNFTTYNAIKDAIVQHRRENGGRGGRSKTETCGLKPHESLILGGLSGGLGPIVNNPLDVVKTRQQRQIVVEGIAPKYHGVVQSCILISKEEGMLALWKGIGPRLARIMPGQAITFATYESISKKLRQFL